MLWAELNDSFFGKEKSEHSRSLLDVTSLDTIKNILYVDRIQQMPMKMPTRLTESPNFILLPEIFDGTLDRGGEYHE